MIRVMLVEDEPPILRSVKSLIESAAGDFQVVACAYDGEEAISMLPDVKPDVLFTDIRMPVMDGIALLGHVHQNMQGVLSIILSGYQDFEYAKKGMQFGAFDYLLKPVSVSELTALLCRLSGVLAIEKEKKRKEYIVQTLHGPLPGKADESIFPRGHYAVMLACAGSFPTFPTDCASAAAEFWKQHDLEPLVAASLQEGETFWVAEGKTCSEKILVLSLGDAVAGRARAVAEMVAGCLGGGSMPVNIAVGTVLPDVCKAGLCAKELRAVLNRAVVIGRSGLFMQDGSGKKADAPCVKVTEIDALARNVFTQAVGQGSVRLLCRELHALLQKWEKQQVPQITVESMLVHLICLCRQALFPAERFDISALELDIRECTTASGSYQELFKHIWCFFDEMLSMRADPEAKKDETAELMSRVDDYILGHFTEPVTNRMLSDSFGLVPSYLSRLFRNYKGMTPSEYLISLRMQKAKELMGAGQGLLLKDIAQIVGYSDPLYFSRIFKKETGVWPTEFKARSRPVSVETP